MAKYVTNEAALKRGVESDPVVRRALDGLLASGIAPGKCTAKQFTTAILHFLTRTIHYGLLGLDLGDEDCELFTTVYQTQASRCSRPAHPPSPLSRVPRWCAAIV